MGTITSGRPLTSSSGKDALESVTMSGVGMGSPRLEAADDRLEEEEADDGDERREVEHPE